MIERRQYRGCLKEGIRGEVMTEGLKAAGQTIRQMIGDGVLLTASLYEYGSMCFLYYEALRPDVVPEEFLGELTPFLEMWPEETGKTPWALMYHIYHHSVPEDVGEWERDRGRNPGAEQELAPERGRRPKRQPDRGGKKNRIGRIAFLYPEKLFSYTYWHQAIVEEGLLKGDKYQCIALHENILFSYFEEPKTMVNIRKEAGLESKVIDEWTAADPESHFDREKAGGNNFLIIRPMLSVGRGDL